MRPERKARRSYGTGSLFTYRGAWYAKWHLGNRQVKRKVGTKREPGTRDGLTRTQAERRLRRMMDETRVAPVGEHITVEEAGERYLHHIEFVMERKRSTVQDYRIMLNRHLGPYFAGKDVDRITPADVAAYIRAQSRKLARQTVVNQTNFLHGMYRYAVTRGWVATNPVLGVERPRSAGRHSDIRFLDGDELEALLRAVPTDRLGSTDRALYLTAALTGLRQGELVALRWRDVDWIAGLVRVRRSYSRGQFGTPKSRRSSRAVPMADRVAAELERHFQRSAYQADDDLVFGDPDTGKPYVASTVRIRFKDALTAAKVRPVRFHDLRHTFGTRMAAAGAPLRTLQEWMGHAQYATTEIYADYAPDESRGRELAERAFGAGTNSGTNLSTTEKHSELEKPSKQAQEQSGADA